MQFFDRAPFSSRVITTEGFLSATAHVGRPGVQEYVKGVDFADEHLPDNLKTRPFGATIRVLRPIEEVFKPESMVSFAHKPVTNNHPATKVVNAENVRRYQVGFSKEVTRNGDILEAQILVQDGCTIKEIEDGKDQISLGYEAEIDFTPGLDEMFGAYDAVQRNIMGNHIAIVDRARAGVDFRLQDSQPNGVAMKIRVIDGKQIELSDDAAAVFDVMKTEVETKASELKAARVELADAKAKADKAEGELAAAKSQAVTDADIRVKVDALVKERMRLIDSASKVIPGADFTGQSDREVRLSVIKTLGDSKVEIADDASDDYVTAAFNALVATAAPKSRKLADGLSGDELDTAAKARQAMIDARTKK